MMLRQFGSRSLARRTHPPLQVFLRRTSRTFASVRAEEKDPIELDRITTLPNGIRVATEALPGHFSGVGVYIDAGSRYENAQLQGVSHFIDRLAFKSTKSRSSDEMLEMTESLGGNVQCASSRECLMYQVATFNSSIPSATELLADTIRNPLITGQEVKEQVSTVEYEIAEIWSKPEMILPELVHMAAYQGNTLGNPLLCPEDRLSSMDRSLMESYRSHLYLPERTVIAFAGVDHGVAVDLARRHFGDMAASAASVGKSASEHKARASDPSPEFQTSLSHPPQQDKAGILSKIPLLKNLSTSATHNATVQSFDPMSIQPPAALDLKQVSHYTGGFLCSPAQPQLPNPNLQRLSHIHLAFEALPISSPDIYALATLQTLLGGGGSFSAGGPGKGMYSRLYTNVLNRQAWVESCIAFNHAYNDSGLFGIAASCVPAQIGSMLEVMCRELQALTLEQGPAALREDEVQRAKNQLKSSLLMNLESRMVELEDLGRQVQSHGRKVGVKEMCQKIEALQVADLRRVARQVFGGLVQNKGRGKGGPTVVMQQDADEGLKRFDWPEIQDRIARWKLGRL